MEKARLLWRAWTAFVTYLFGDTTEAELRARINEFRVSVGLHPYER